MPTDKEQRNESGEVCCRGVCCDAQGPVVQSMRSYNRSPVAGAALKRFSWPLTVLISPNLPLKALWKPQFLQSGDWMKRATLDVLCNRNELTETRETDNNKKGILKFGRKNSVHKTYKNVSIFAQNHLRMHSLKVIPSDRERLPFLWKILKQMLLEHREFSSYPSRDGHL